MSRSRMLWLTVLALLGSIACNDVPLGVVDNSFLVQVTVNDEKPPQPELDILFIVDNSGSMCVEQAQLTDKFDTLISQIVASIPGDIRIAVATPSGTEEGAFRRGCDTVIMDNCANKSNPAGYCKSTYKEKPGEWRCETRNGAPACVLPCSKNEGCDTIDVQALKSCDGFELDAKGYITNDSTTLAQSFRCIASVGADTYVTTEQGLKMAQLALEPNGINAASQFLRPNAYLALVFISDEDDCSYIETSNGKSPFGTDPQNHFAKCSLLTDQLVPVGDYVNFFKSLKSDPGRVIVAAISGDAKVPGLSASDPGFTLNSQVIAQRQKYLSDKQTKLDTHICTSDFGAADYGRRYRELIDKFGSNGVFANICDGDFGPALSLIAKKIVDIFTGTCLQKLPDCPQCDPSGVDQYKSALQVTISGNSGSRILSSSEYRLESLAKCQGLNTASLAVVPNSAPSPGDKVTLLYQTSISE